MSLLNKLSSMGATIGLALTLAGCEPTPHSIRRIENRPARIDRKFIESKKGFDYIVNHIPYDSTLYFLRAKRNDLQCNYRVSASRYRQTNVGDSVDMPVSVLFGVTYEIQEDSSTIRVVTETGEEKHCVPNRSLSGFK